MARAHAVAVLALLVLVVGLVVLSGCPSNCDNRTRSDEPGDDDVADDDGGDDSGADDAGDGESPRGIKSDETHVPYPVSQIAAHNDAQGHADHAQTGG